MLNYKKSAPAKQQGTPPRPPSPSPTAHESDNLPQTVPVQLLSNQTETDCGYIQLHYVLYVTCSTESEILHYAKHSPGKKEHLTTLATGSNSTMLYHTNQKRQPH